MYYFGIYLIKYPLFLLPWDGTTAGVADKVWLSIAQAAGYALGDSFEFEAKPEGKRSREENTAALAALKKLKLRTQAESS